MKICKITQMSNTNLDVGNKMYYREMIRHGMSKSVGNGAQ